MPAKNKTLSEEPSEYLTKYLGGLLKLTQKVTITWQVNTYMHLLNHSSFINKDNNRVIHLPNMIQLSCIPVKMTYASQRKNINSMSDAYSSL